MNEQIPLKEVLASVDSNYRELWDDINDDQRKALKNEFWILNRYISNVKTNDLDQQTHFVLTVNEFFNKNWFAMQKHPKLLWLLLCMCNYNGSKIFYHEYINLGKNNKNNKVIKLLEEAFPSLSNQDLETLAKISTKEELKTLALEIGWSNADVKNL
jgi:hypothetical protein